jgi:hypothetical protein
MAKISDVGQIVTGAGAMYRFKEVAKLMGATVRSSSDGATYNASGDQITHSGPGAGGMANSSAWYCLKWPCLRRETVYQRSTTTNQTWYVKYSALSHFTGGSPGVTQVPSATDERLLLGAGTDAVPTFGNMFTADNAYRVHIVGFTTPISGVYPINMFCTITPGSAQAIGQHTIEPMAPGSFSAADQDPCLIRFTATPQGNYMGWFGYGTGGASWVTGWTTDPIIAAGTLAADPDGNDVNIRPRFEANVSGIRVKGWGSTLAVMGLSRTYPATMNTQGIAGGKLTDAHVYLNSWCMPYPENTVPQV